MSSAYTKKENDVMLQITACSKLICKTNSLGNNVCHFIFQISLTAHVSHPVGLYSVIISDGNDGKKNPTQAVIMWNDPLTTPNF